VIQNYSHDGYGTQKINHQNSLVAQSQAVNEKLCVISSAAVSDVADTAAVSDVADTTAAVLEVAHSTAAPLTAKLTNLISILG
jgi:hypothetical protein